MPSYKSAVFGEKREEKRTNLHDSPPCQRIYPPHNTHRSIVVWIQQTEAHTNSLSAVVVAAAIAATILELSA